MNKERIKLSCRFLRSNIFISNIYIYYYIHGNENQRLKDEDGFHLIELIMGSYI